MAFDINKTAEQFNDQICRVTVFDGRSTSERKDAFILVDEKSTMICRNGPDIFLWHADCKFLRAPNDNTFELSHNGLIYTIRK